MEVSAEKELTTERDLGTTIESSCSGEDDIQSYPNVNLFIGDLSKECVEADMLALFSTVGEVDEVKIKRSKATQKPLGYGFVKMKTSEGAHACIDKLQGAVLCGRSIRIGWGDLNCYLLLDNLDSSVTLDKVHEMFQPFGLQLELKDTCQQEGKGLGNLNLAI